MSLSSFLSATGNKFAASVESGISAGDVAGWIDTGSYTLNAILCGSIYGGCASNKIAVFGGDSGTGKTFLVMGVVKQFLEMNQTGIVMYFETESAISKQMFVSRGIDASRVGIVPVTTVQEFRNQALAVIDNYEKRKKADQVPMMFVLDSIGMLSTNKEVEDITSGKDTLDMTRSKLLKGAFRVLTLRMGRANIPLICTNHTYSTQEMFSKVVQGGGSGAIYSSSAVVTLSKAKEQVDATGGKKQVGVILTATATKSRFTRENSKAKVRLRFDGGMDRYHGLLDLAVDAGIWKKVSTKIELPDGTKLFGNAIGKNPEKYYTKDILDQIDEYCKKTFEFQSSDSDDVEDFDSETDEE
jgi:RecA/RadA recombinase